MNVDKILKDVSKLHASAKSGSLKFQDNKYDLIFDGHVYEVTNKDGEQVTRFNTRKLSVAKKWLKEYLMN